MSVRITLEAPAQPQPSPFPSQKCPCLDDQLSGHSGNLPGSGPTATVSVDIPSLGQGRKHTSHLSIQEQSHMYLCLYVHTHTHTFLPGGLAGTHCPVLPTTASVAFFAKFLAGVLQDSLGAVESAMRSALGLCNSRDPRGLGTVQTMVTAWAGTSIASRVTPSVSLTTVPFSPLGLASSPASTLQKGSAWSFNKGCLSTVA